MTSTRALSNITKYVKCLCLLAMYWCSYKHLEGMVDKDYEIKFTVCTKSGSAGLPYMLYLSFPIVIAHKLEVFHNTYVTEVCV